MTTASALPAPGPDALAHSARLRALIEAEIAAAGGAIAFERYMELALYAPGMGYYSAGAAKFGGAGDFITAAECSTLYAHCLAAQCREILDELGGGSVLELGAGSGALAAEMLAWLAHAGRLPARYYILEVSAELQARQRATLSARVPQCCERVEWIARPEDLRLRGIVLASEVLDALPVALFRIADPPHARIQELAVRSNETGFALVARPAAAALMDAVAQIEADLPQALPNGYSSECCPRLASWLRAITASLERGIMLVVDYGLPRREYYAPERSGGTLLCHYRQRVHGDPFHAPGLQDIGAWVDYSAVARAGAMAGLHLAGFTTQAHFLIGCGLDEHFQRALAQAPEQARARTQEVQLLTLPGQMGERFRVLALARDYRRALRGFAGRDLSRTL